MELVNIQEVCQMMRCSPSTIRRRLCEARAGKSSFPKPIHGDRKRGLWRKEDIELWSEAPPPNVPYIESPAVQSRRLQLIHKKLQECHGIKIKVGGNEADGE